MFCPKCGNKLPDTAAFCNACGATIEKKVPVAESAKPAANTAVQGLGAGLNPKLIGVIAAVVVVLIMLVVAVGSCSSNSGSNSISSGSTAAASAASGTTVGGTSGAAAGGTSSTTTADSSGKYVGTWRDFDYGDTMELNANGLCVINQTDVGTTYWQWETTSDGIRINDGSHTYSLTYGYANGRETLYNNSKGLKFQR